ncbi:hypothetical protein H0H92_006127 [Tricholoma furcatifolium]|nr:hypothetical protein H0H92_006127 [Tricholoma furcatifolium]
MLSYTVRSRNHFVNGIFDISLASDADRYLGWEKHATTGLPKIAITKDPVNEKPDPGTPTTPTSDEPTATDTSPTHQSSRDGSSTGHHDPSVPNRYNGIVPAPTFRGCPEITDGRYSIRNAVEQKWIKLTSDERLDWSLEEVYVTIFQSSSDLWIASDDCHSRADPHSGLVLSEPLFYPLILERVYHPLDGYAYYICDRYNSTKVVSGEVTTFLSRYRGFKVAEKSNTDRKQLWKFTRAD